MMFEKLENPFQRSEYLDRLGRCKKEMASKDVDCFLLIDPANIYYFSGCFGDSPDPGLPEPLAIMTDAEEPILFMRKQDAPVGWYTCFMDDSNVIPYPESYVGGSDLDGFDFVFDDLRRRGAKRIGIELDSLSVPSWSRVQERGADFTFVDMSDIVMQMRLIKSPAEIGLMKQAARITDQGFRTAQQTIKPGVRECDVAAAVTSALIRGTPEHAGSPSDVILLCGGDLTGTSHINWTDRVIEAGKHYNLEFSGYRFKYPAPLMRTFSVGAPSAKLKRLQDYMIEGCNAALSQVRPGVTCGHIARTFGDVVEKGGYVKDSRCGYPIGIDWMESSCYFRTDDETVLSENMTFHLMLGMWVEEQFGAVISESFCVTDDGCDVFSSIDRELIVV